MIQPLLDRLQQFSLISPTFQRAEATDVLARHGVESWFLYSYDEWKKRWHVWRGLLWAINNIDHKGRILETGCGCGWNLFWLAANGFESLTGIDINTSAIAAGNELAQGAGIPVRLRSDNALNPASLQEAPFHLLLALNWTYHVPEFALAQFLDRYRELLIPGGVVLLDTVEKSFGTHPKSCFLTSDWSKPESERRPSEYVHRFTLRDIREISASCGFRVAAYYTRWGTIPRSIYMLRRE